MDKRFPTSDEAGEQHGRPGRDHALEDAGGQGGSTNTATVFNRLLETVAGGVRRLRGGHFEAGRHDGSWTDAGASEAQSGTRAELEAAVAKAQAAWQKASDDLDKAQIERDKAKANWDKLANFQSTADADRRKLDADRRRAAEALDRLMPDQRASDSDRRKANAALAAFVRVVAERHAAFVERNNAEAAWSHAAADLISAIAKRKKAVAALEELNRAEGRP